MPNGLLSQIPCCTFTTFVPGQVCWCCALCSFYLAKSPNAFTFSHLMGWCSSPILSKVSFWQLPCYDHLDPDIAHIDRSRPGTPGANSSWSIRECLPPAKAGQSNSYSDQSAPIHVARYKKDFSRRVLLTNNHHKTCCIKVLTFNYNSTP